MPAASVRGSIALIAEDSRIQAKMLQNCLEQAGYEVRVAGDGAAALELVRQGKPDIIISDIEMPKMTGYEFCRAVKEDPGLRDVPVILLSTLSDPVDIIKGLDAGADNYVTKPYDANYLLGRVESLMNTPVDDTSPGDELAVNLAGQTFRVKSGRRQVLNLLVSTFENAVEKNRELHRLNEQLTVAKDRLQQSNVELESLNGKLDTANRRMSHDLQAAARVQQSLLPSGTLETPGARFAWKYTPCDELAGDFLNYFPLDDRHIALYVVDVSGHGAASALLAVAIGRLMTPQASASSLLIRIGKGWSGPQIVSPSEVAAELNRRFQMESQNGLYFTMMYGVLDLKTLKLRYVVAGHPPAVVIKSNGKPEFLPGDGFPIGMMEEMPYEESTLQLSAGDRLYLYSDGVPEAMDPELQQFTNERMLATLTASQGQPFDASVDNLFASVKDWCEPTGPRDDVTILGVTIGEQ